MPARLVRHTYAVIDVARQLQTVVREAETGQRGFLLTGREDYLQPYDAALGQITLLEGDLRRLTVDNPAQQDRLQGLAGTIQRKLEEMAQTIRLRRDLGRRGGAATGADRSRPVADGDHRGGAGCPDRGGGAIAGAAPGRGRCCPGTGALAGGRRHRAGDPADPAPPGGCWRRRGRSRPMPRRRSAPWPSNCAARSTASAMAWRCSTPRRGCSAGTATSRRCWRCRRAAATGLGLCGARRGRCRGRGDGGLPRESADADPPRPRRPLGARAGGL